MKVRYHFIIENAYWVNWNILYLVLLKIVDIEALISFLCLFRRRLTRNLPFVCQTLHWITFLFKLMSLRGRRSIRKNWDEVIQTNKLLFKMSHWRISRFKSIIRRYIYGPINMGCYGNLTSSVQSYYDFFNSPKINLIRWKEILASLSQQIMRSKSR